MTLGRGPAVKADSDNTANSFEGGVMDKVRGFMLFVVCLVFLAICGLIPILLYGTIGYIFLHFIQKFW
jgi:hypothetical protein